MDKKINEKRIRTVQELMNMITQNEFDNIKVCYTWLNFAKEELEKTIEDLKTELK